MEKIRENIFKVIIKIISLFSVLVLFFIIAFILRESLVFFRTVPIRKFIFNTSWNPIGHPEDLSILPIILASLYVSLLALIIALPIGVGAAVFLSVREETRLKKILSVFIDILAGIPSVIYGFVGLLVLVKFFEKNFKLSSGESVLTGGILLSIMILPYIISTCTDSMEKIYKEYIRESKAMGISENYFIRKILLPESKKAILAAILLALGRAMGETMAVMMVIGNAPIMPKLLGKCQTIPSLIALEMGMAEVGSLHYHALFSAGLVLVFILLIINIIFYLIKKNIDI